MQQYCLKPHHFNQLKMQFTDLMLPLTPCITIPSLFCFQCKHISRARTTQCLIFKPSFTRITPDIKASSYKVFIYSLTKYLLITKVSQTLLQVMEIEQL